MKLERAWEAIQDIYTTYANINAYKYGMPEFCNFMEDTFIITLDDGKKIKAYYNPKETEKVQERGLKDFLDSNWRREFKNRSKAALKESSELINKYHKNLTNYSFDELRETFSLCNKNLNDLFVVFEASAPQYTALVEGYVKDLLLEKVPTEKVNEIFHTLTLPEEQTPMLEEETEREKLFNKLRGLSTKEKDGLLNDHVRKFGLTYAADGAQPLKLDELKKDRERWIKGGSVSGIVEKWKKDINDLSKKKQSISSEYEISKELLDLTEDIAYLGALRINLRVKGWMPIAYILTQEILPKLSENFEYSLEELLACRDFEIKNILMGDNNITKEELRNRNIFVAYGLHNKKDFFLSGVNGQESFKSEFEFPVLNEVKGQSAMRGVVEGQCFVIKWDNVDISKLVEEMPKGAILVAGQTRPQLMPLIKKASAIVTDEGGLLSHAAIVSRELRIPAVIGTKHATDILKTGMKVKVDADNGVVTPI